MASGSDGAAPANGTTAGITAVDLQRRGELCPPFARRLSEGRDQVALDYLARETSLDVVNAVVQGIPDQELCEFLVEQILLAAAVLSSEAHTGVERIREELRRLGRGVSDEEPARARQLYDLRVEELGQLFFALGRRFHRLEVAMSGCPLTGSSEQRRGRYGQRARDLAGDLRFMRLEQTRWVRRFVPLNRQASRTTEDTDFLEARLDAVVDELGLRLREIHETLSATIFEQLLLFDESLTRKKLFRGDADNVGDVSLMVEWLSAALECAREYDHGRQPEQLRRVKGLLEGFDPTRLLSVSGLRESEQRVFLRCVAALQSFEGVVTPGGDDDPIQPFLLLTGDFIKGLRRQPQNQAQSGDPFG